METKRSPNQIVMRSKGSQVGFGSGSCDKDHHPHMSNSFLQWCILCTTPWYVYRLQIGETVRKKKIDTALFAADVTADHQYGAAFLFERRLTAVMNGLQARTPLTIIDSRITPAQMPTLDYRAAGSPPFNPPSNATNTSEDDDGP